MFFNSDYRHGYGGAVVVCLFLLAGLAGSVQVASAQGVTASSSCAGPGECLCDNSYEDCRTPLLNLIRNEDIGIDVSMWFMSDHRYRDEIIKRKQAGVPIRIIGDVQADTNYPANKSIRDALIAAGIPIRDCISSKGINHWKAMIFEEQGKVQFSAANFANGSFSPTVTPYVTYVDEAIYFTDDPAIYGSFVKYFDDHWTNTTEFANLANISGTPQRKFPVGTYTVHSSMNFVPYQYYEDRLRNEVNLENQRIDAAMFRITSSKLPDTLIARKAAGVDVRLITDQRQYRNTTYFWHSYNVDRMYMAGIPVKWKDKTLTEQDMHQKSVVLYSRGLATSTQGGPAPMVVFGSANWTSSSNSGQREHNYFSRKDWMVQWFMAQFERKWNNLRADGSSIGQTVFDPFVPGYPETPLISAPANGATGVGTAVTLRWEGGWWAHKYDVLLSEDPTVLSSGVLANPQHRWDDFFPGSATAGVKSTKESFAVPVTLKSGTTYYWQIRGKTMANMTKISPRWSFTTAGTPPKPSGDPDPSPTLSPGDVVLYPGRATVRVGNWVPRSDSTAAGGVLLENRNDGAATVTTPLAAPAHYFEMQFTATSQGPYRLWLRGRAASNSGYNDSVWVQFSNSTNYPIGSTSATWVNLLPCSSATLSGWGWQDNEYVSTNCAFLGPQIHFASTGTQTIRVQIREDGISLDQIVLSPDTFLNSSPGAPKADTVRLPEQNAVGSTSASAAEVVLHAGDITTANASGSWSLVPDDTAAGGQRISNPNAGSATITTARAAPADYFQMQFTATKDRPYRLWMRGQAAANSGYNDSVWVQFSNSISGPGGSAVNRIGSTAGEWVNLQDGPGSTLSGWGWQDNGYGGLGRQIFFDRTGIQSLRVQVREDGASFDQIVLSPEKYLHVAPGSTTSDDTILSSADGS